MTYTPYSAANQSLSDAGHKAAQRLLYPRLFGVDASELAFESTTLNLGDRERILDGEMGIDRIVRVSVAHLRHPLGFTIQERFRQPKYASWRDITITEWNHNSNKPSELYKINAGLFLYGYHDPWSDDFIEAVAIDTTALLVAISKHDVRWTQGTNRRSNQSFFCFRFDDLLAAGLVAFHYRADAGEIPLCDQSMLFAPR